MVQVIPVILTFHTHGTGISAGIISDLYRDYICSAGSTPANSRFFLLQLHEIAGMHRNLLLLLPSNYKSTIGSVQNASVTTSKIFAVHRKAKLKG